MGNNQSSSSSSKKGSTSSISTEPSVEFNFTNQTHSSEPTDPELQSFASNLHARTNHVINTLASEGVEVKALSLDSLKQVTECLTDMNFEVVNVIAQCKDDIWNNQELFQLVEEYFENSLATLDFCTALEKKLKLVRDKQLMIIKIALQQFQDEDAAGERKYTRTLKEFVKFREAEDPFKVDFFEAFQAVYQRQMSLLEKLKARKNKLDKKLKYIHAWRRVTNVLFVATFAAVLICSVVTALVAAGPVASAVAAAAAIPLSSVGKYIDSLWKNYEDVLKGQKELLSTMNVGTHIAIKDLDNIRVLVDQLQLEIESIVNSAMFAIKEEQEADEEGGAGAGVAVKLVADEVKKRLEVFERNVDTLEALAARCAEDIRKGRSVLIQRIIKHPNN